jgi:hypothetical protein
MAMGNPSAVALQKQRIMTNFNAITKGYDRLGFTQRCAKHLLELANLQQEK